MHQALVVHKSLHATRQMLQGNRFKKLFSQRLTQFYRLFLTVSLFIGYFFFFYKESLCELKRIGERYPTYIAIFDL